MSGPVQWMFDFDSTLVRVEALDELADIALQGRAGRAALLERIRHITRLGMEGAMTIDQSLRERMALLAIDPSMLPPLVERLVAGITPSFLAHRDRLLRLRDRVWVVSGGCHEWIEPTVQRLGLRADRVIANRLRAAEGGRLELDPASPCMVDHGKATAIEHVGVPRPRVMVGDGMTDWRVKERGACDHFICFTEVVRRAPVAQRADAEAADLAQALDAHEPA
jgi:D-3-phosphoglycerate dehydrogenase